MLFPHFYHYFTMAGGRLQGPISTQIGVRFSPIQSKLEGGFSDENLLHPSYLNTRVSEVLYR